MYFDRFDICEAYYMYATLWHGGQGSEEYRIFGRLYAIDFEPSPMISVDTLEENARAIYDGLVVRGIHASIARALSPGWPGVRWTQDRWAYIGLLYGQLLAEVSA